MSDKSRIEWADATSNPVTGCSKVSPGCAWEADAIEMLGRAESGSDEPE